MPRHAPSYNPAVRVVLLEGQFQRRSAVVSAAAKALVRGIWLQPDGVAQASPRRPLFLAYLLSSYQRHAAAFRSPHTTLPLAHLDLQHFRERGHAASNLLLVQAGKSKPQRSEERRVGKECRSRWWRYH